MRCIRCGGTGKYLGNGMMLIDCNRCDGFGNEIEENIDKKPEKNSIDKRSKAYKDAIKDIMKLDSNLSRFDAEMMFEKTYDKV